MGTIYTELQPFIPGSAWTIPIALISQANTDIFQTSVTLENGDVTLSKDGGAFSNLANLPVETETFGLLTITLSAEETLGITKFALILFHDLNGNEWQDLLLEVSVSSSVNVVQVIRGGRGHKAHYICPLSNSLLCGSMPMCQIVNCDFNGKDIDPYKFK